MQQQQIQQGAEDSDELMHINALATSSSQTNAVLARTAGVVTTTTTATTSTTSATIQPTVVRDVMEEEIVFGEDEGQPITAAAAAPAAVGQEEEEDILDRQQVALPPVGLPAIRILREVTSSQQADEFTESRQRREQRRGDLSPQQRGLSPQQMEQGFFLQSAVAQKIQTTRKDLPKKSPSPRALKRLNTKAAQELKNKYGRKSSKRKGRGSEEEQEEEEEEEENLLGNQDEGEEEEAPIRSASSSALKKKKRRIQKDNEEETTIRSATSSSKKGKASAASGKTKTSAGQTKKASQKSLFARQVEEERRKSVNGETAIPRAAFVRLIREIAQGYKPDARFGESALAALQEAAESHLVDMMESANLCAIHGKRVTLQKKDMDLVYALRGMSIRPLSEGERRKGAGAASSSKIIKIKKRAAEKDKEAEETRLDDESEEEENILSKVTKQREDDDNDDQGGGAGLGGRREITAGGESMGY